ncbi:MAG: transposase [Verrucomicrobiota bacterium]
MPRKLRVEYPGAIYHVMNRGDRREPIFRDARDRRRFIDTLEETCAKTGWQVHALCLMPNHFHLVVETPQGNLVAGMKWFLGTYTARFNRRHRVFGHLFGGRYKALLVDGSGNGYLRTVCEYVHLNPHRARLVGPKTPLSDYPWSSYAWYLAAPRKRPSWLRVDRVLGECGIPRDSVAGRREYERQMERRRWEADGQEYGGIRRGWCLGDAAFRRELLAAVAERAGAHHYGEELRESAEAKAQRLITQAVRQAGWRAADLSRRRKGDPWKVKLAQRLRRETTVTVEWIARQLHMGTRGHLTHLLYWAGRSKPKARR